MKETKFYHRALDMALLNGKAVKAALDEQIGKEPAKTHESVRFPWRRVVMIATACLVLTAPDRSSPSLHPGGGPELAGDHLSHPGLSDRRLPERPPIEVLDNMIATAKPEDTDVKVIQIDRTDSQAVNSEGALKVAELLKQDVRITLGDTLFDGNTAYVTLHLGGTAALPLLEDYTGGNATKVQGGPPAGVDFFEGGPGEEYMSGENEPSMSGRRRLVLELDDGSTISQFLNMVETDAIQGALGQL